VKIDIVVLWRCCQVGQPLLYGLYRPELEGIHLFAELSALILAHAGYLLQKFGDGALFAQIFYLCGANILRIAGCGQALLQGCSNFV